MLTFVLETDRDGPPSSHSVNASRTPVANDCSLGNRYFVLHPAVDHTGDSPDGDSEACNGCGSDRTLCIFVEFSPNAGGVARSDAGT